MLGGLGFGIYNDSPGPLPHLSMLGGLGKSPFVLAAGAGAYSVGGYNTVFAPRSYAIVAEAGLYNLAGSVAVLSGFTPRTEFPGPLPHIGMMLRGGGEYRLTADTGLYSYSVSDSISDFHSVALVGSYGVTGFPANLRTVFGMTAEAGAYFFNGKDIVFGITGTSRTMPADTGYYFVSGIDPEVVHAYTLACEQGFYGLAGQAATFEFGVVIRQLRLGPEPGFYTHQGAEFSGLVYSGGHPVFPEGPPGQGGGGGGWWPPGRPPEEDDWRKKKRKKKLEGDDQDDRPSRTSLRDDLAKAYESAPAHLSQTEIAQRLDIPLGTVKTRASRGTRRLRGLVDGGGPT